MARHDGRTEHVVDPGRLTSFSKNQFKVKFLVNKHAYLVKNSLCMKSDVELIDLKHIVPVTILIVWFTMTILLYHTWIDTRALKSVSFGS